MQDIHKDLLGLPEIKDGDIIKFNNGWKAIVSEGVLRGVKRWGEKSSIDESFYDEAKTIWRDSGIIWRRPCKSLRSQRFAAYNAYKKAIHNWEGVELRETQKPIIHRLALAHAIRSHVV